MPVSSTNGSTKKPFQRLPSDVIPIHYDIYLRPNLVDLVFKGSLKVELEVKKATDTLICNAAEMTVDEIKINDEPIAESKISEEDETLTMKLSKSLEPGTKAILSCKFTGELNDKMRGFYRYFLYFKYNKFKLLVIAMPRRFDSKLSYWNFLCSFRSKYTQDGEERYAATTQFESTDARRAFPCWDEPALKSTFSISVSAPKNRVVLSNMPMIEETKDDEDPSTYRVCNFDKTPKMSTYLVAFIIGEFEAVEATSPDGILVRVWTPMVNILAFL